MIEYKLEEHYLEAATTKVKVCSRCIYDERVPQIYFDSDGVCNYCKLIKRLIKQYGTNTKLGEKNLKNIINTVKINGKSKKYDCIVGVSGGTDSSYLLYLCKKWKCNNGNEKSKNAALRLGFKFEGIFRQAAVVKGRNRDTAWFSVIDKEWKKLKKGYLRYFSKKNLDKNFNQKKSLKFS